jgi:hypothetical protein
VLCSPHTTNFLLERSANSEDHELFNFCRLHRSKHRGALRVLYNITSTIALWLKPSRHRALTHWQWAHCKSRTDLRVLPWTLEWQKQGIVLSTTPHPTPTRVQLRTPPTRNLDPRWRPLQEYAHDGGIPGRESEAGKMGGETRNDLHYVRTKILHFMLMPF